jgi:hypothetical protein
MKKLALVVVLVALGAGSEQPAATEQEPNIRFIMQRKLDNAHSLLEALITEDFETLEDSADALRALSEESGWFVQESSEYTELSSAFRRTVSDIEQSARDKDLHRAALGYVDMTLRCVGCHEHLRATQRARAGAR